MKTKNIKISLILNIIIFILTIIASIIMFTGFQFMKGSDLVLETTKLGMFKFFTVDSNLFMGIMSLLFAIKETQLIKGKITSIPKMYYIVKFMSTSAVALTFVIVFTYLGPISKGGTFTLLKNSNLFLHLIIPVMSIINFLCFEKTSQLTFLSSLYGIVPTACYGVFYLINILIHMQDGQVDFKYDWYWFVQNGVWTAIIVIPVLFLISYLISLILWKLNYKKSNNC